ncbi:helix-turn-helix domain-containing protein [Actinopolymorpha alba]|uniref:helix-turn-helix domain-containing protein n=1 Tax=Actinopolymorpha alba TaxID=533267 RepID=UPI00037B72ED|nr:GAF domain-containing protein [Actinopolymorpha alba]
MAVRSFVELLYEEAPPEAFEEEVRRAQEAGVDDEALRALRAELAVALRVREQMSRQRQREAELSALYETANDLTALRDVDAVLTAIVRRARQLLGADLTYLSLNDPDRGQSFMRMTDGSVSAKFRKLRLPFGTGLLGLVAQTGAPYFTDDYFADRRFLHRDYIDEAVAEEGIRAILGVPLLLGGRVLGALLAGNRSARPFPPGEVALLGSLAAHAAIALENARLFEETQAAVRDLDAANATIRAHSEAVELAASAHDRLADVVLHGGGVDAVAAVLADVLGGQVSVRDPDGRPLAGHARPALPPGPAPAALEDAIGEARRSGRTVEAAAERHATPSTPRQWVAAAVAGDDLLGTLVLCRQADLAEADRRILERGALVTALLLLFQRSVAEAEDRVRGELLDDLLSDPHRDPATLRERARRHRTDLAADHVVVVVRAEDAERHRTVAAASRLAATRGGLGGLHDADVVLAIPGKDAAAVARSIRDRLADLLDTTVTVGAAGPGSGPDGIVAAYRAARQCLAVLLALGRHGAAADAAGLGFTRLLLGGGAAEIEGFLRMTIGPLLEYDDRRGTDLVGTVEAWFAEGGSPGRAGERLHIHPNTVAQRLERVTVLLGGDWRTPERALDVQLALRLWRLQSAKAW